MAMQLTELIDESISKDITGAHFAICHMLNVEVSLKSEVTNTVVSDTSENLAQNYRTKYQTAKSHSGRMLDISLWIALTVPLSTTCCVQKKLRSLKFRRF